jgi:hypothetical protein
LASKFGRLRATVNVRHIAATPVGHRLTAAAEVTGVEGRRIEFKVTVRDEVEQIWHGTRRRILWAGATAHPTAEWITRQLTEACGWEQAPQYLIRDRDRAYGEVVTRRLRALGIRDRPTSPRSPWQNAYVERLIGSVRRECVDNVVVLGERHLRHLLLSYKTYYNETRTHLSLNKDAPSRRAVQAAGLIFCQPILGGLHHQYGRILIFDRHRGIAVP